MWKKIKIKHLHLSKKFKQKYPNFYFLITGIGVIFVWRGVWGLLDLYFFPGNEVFSIFASVVIGLVILFINDFSLSELDSH